MIWDKKRISLIYRYIFYFGRLEEFSHYSFISFPLGIYRTFYYFIGSKRVKKIIVANSLDKLFDDACADEHKYLDPIPGGEGRDENKGGRKFTFTRVRNGNYARAPNIYDE